VSLPLAFINDPVMYVVIEIHLGLVNLFSLCHKSGKTVVSVTKLIQEA